jgi:hypothetical protein
MLMDQLDRDIRSEARVEVIDDRLKVLDGETAPPDRCGVFPAPTGKGLAS